MLPARRIMVTATATAPAPVPTHQSQLLTRIKQDVEHRSQPGNVLNDWYNDNHSDSWTDGSEHADG